MLTFPKDTAQFSWTRHIKNKMVFYHLSGAQIMRIFRKPKRREEGIAKDTVAAMIPKVGGGKTARPEEIWIMYRVNSQRTTHNSQKTKEAGLLPSVVDPKLSVVGSKSKFTLISTWRYPGVTKVGERPQIPEDVLAELNRVD